MASAMLCLSGSRRPSVLAEAAQAACQDAVSRFREASTDAPRPYLSTGTDHYAYALLCANGWRHQAACEKLGIVPETARRWRRDLGRVAAAFFGHAVTYEYAARFATDEALRRHWEVVRAE